MKQYTAIIVDDDEINVMHLKRIVSAYCHNIKIVGQALSNQEAIMEINSKKPDIVFLDIVMQEETIFEIMGELEDFTSQIVFVTSEARFAHQAFKYGAADYILKPLESSDVILAVQKAIRRIELQKFFDNPNPPESHFHHEEEPKMTFIAVPSIDKIDFLKLNDIMFFTADGKYTSICLSNGKKYLTNKNLGDYERSLNKAAFFRIHHSYIINMDYVVKINKRDGAYCELANGLAIPIAKRRQDDFNRFIKIKE